MVNQLIPHALGPVLFLFKTGVRLGNVLSLDWSQITLSQSNQPNARGEILFHVKDKEYKDGRPHIMPIDDDLYWLLAKQGIKDTGPVFTYGEPCDCPYCTRHAGEQIKSIKKTFKASLRRAGISQDFRIHDIRHTVGARILKRLGDLKAAQEYLGHKDIRSTMRYSKHDIGKKQEIMQFLSKSPTTTPATGNLKTVK